MKGILLPAIAAAITGVGANAEPAYAHSLEIKAAPPTVTISPRPAGRDSLSMPALEYAFDVLPLCAAPFRPRSLSLTVADSRRSLTAEQLQSREALADLRLTVPANQLSPITLSGFCVVPAEAETLEAPPSDAADVGAGSRSLTVTAALSVQASLLCATETEQTITYTSAPLDVTLVCDDAESLTE